MASIAEYKKNIESYNDMNDKVKSIIIYLDKYADLNSQLLTKIDNCYLVDNKDSSIYDRAKDLSVDVSKTSNYLKSVIIPAISNAIRNDQNAINEIESQAEQEKARAAAAAAQSSSSSGSTSSGGSTGSKPKKKGTAMLLE